MQIWQPDAHVREAPEATGTQQPRPQPGAGGVSDVTRNVAAALSRMAANVVSVGRTP